MNQRELISKICDARPRMNPHLFERDDNEVIKQLMDAIKSCERTGAHFSIQVKGFDIIDDFDQVNKILYDYYERAYRNKTKAKRKDNRYEFINLNESDIRLLIVHYLIADKDRQEDLDVIIAVPRIIDKYYFRIDGIMRSTLYQVVDGSTYNNGTSTSKSPSVTMKLIFMAVRVFRRYLELPLSDGSGTIKATHYTAYSFNKTVSALKYIMAKYGFYGTMDYMGIRDVYITNTDPENPEFYTFKKGDTLFVSVPKLLFDQDLITQSFVATVYNSIYEGIPINYFFDTNYWVRSLGSDFNKLNIEKFVEIFTEEDKTVVADTYEKGLSIMDSFQSIYDRCTCHALKLKEEDKSDMYAVLRWMLREYNNLRLKDNLDISVKRIRFAEYVASLYVMKIAKGIYRVADQNKRASIESITRAIKTDPLYLLKAIVLSKMISYRNMVSDMDSMQALKFTYKGVSGLGENGSKSIPDIYRSIQPSHIGRVDLDASSDGNPGITGTLNPFLEMENGFFSGYEEPDTWQASYDQSVSEYYNAKGLKEAVEFQQNLLGVDKSEEISLLNDITCNMEQIIKPIAKKLQECAIFYD